MTLAEDRSSRLEQSSWTPLASLGNDRRSQNEVSVNCVWITRGLERTESPGHVFTVSWFPVVGAYVKDNAIYVVHLYILFSNFEVPLLSDIIF